MSRSRERFTNPNEMAAYHPYGTGATPMVMPLALVQIDQAGMAYQTMEPLWTGDMNSAPIPATAPGSWGQVHQAGRP